MILILILPEVQFQHHQHPSLLSFHVHSSFCRRSHVIRAVPTRKPTDRRKKKKDTSKHEFIDILTWVFFSTSRTHGEMSCWSRQFIAKVQDVTCSQERRSQEVASQFNISLNVGVNTIDLHTWFIFSIKKKVSSTTVVFSRVSSLQRSIFTASSIYKHQPRHLVRGALVMQTHLFDNYSHPVFQVTGALAKYLITSAAPPLQWSCLT